MTIMPMIRDSREPDYFQVDNVLIDNPAYGKVLGPYGIAVYICLCRHANYNTQQAFPSLACISQETGVSKRKVIMSLDILIAAKMLTKETRMRTLPNGKQEHTSTLYTLIHRDRWNIEAGAKVQEVQIAKQRKYWNNYKKRKAEEETARIQESEKVEQECVLAGCA